MKFLSNLVDLYFHDRRKLWKCHYKKIDHFVLGLRYFMLILLVLETEYFSSGEQYHACWCPGDLNRQGISRYGIDHIGLSNMYVGLLHCESSLIWHKIQDMIWNMIYMNTYFIIFKRVQHVNLLDPWHTFCWAICCWVMYPWKNDRLCDNCYCITWLKLIYITCVLLVYIPYCHILL